jgi:hypothetical protein
MKVVIYLKGKRRANKYGLLPIDMTKGKNQARQQIRNPGAGQLGWLRALKFLRYKDAKDSSKTNKMLRPRQHKERKAKSRVRSVRATNRTGASIKLSNLVKYAGSAKVNAKYGAYRGTNSAIAWLKGYWLPKRMKENDRKWKTKYNRILS